MPPSSSGAAAVFCANAQGELSPLEIGMHALHYVSKETGGRGKKGGLSAYAERLGKDVKTLRDHRSGAEVMEKLGVDPHLYLDKAAHLAAIHKLPQACWPECAGHMLRGR